MSKKARRRQNLDRMRAYVPILQPLLRLQHWDVEVRDEPPDDGGNLAECHRRTAQHTARVLFSDQCFKESLEEQRVTVIHELLHLVTHNWHVASQEAFEALDSTPRSWAMERHNHEHEMVVDHLARVLAPYLPLPERE